jgi:hypothetical protein
MTTKIRKTPTASPAVVSVGKVIPSDAVVFARPTKMAERTEAGAENVSILRSMLEQAEKIGQGILARLVLALVLNPSSDVDDKGRTTDALTALTSGDGALSIPRAEVSKARAAFRLVQAAGISSTADPRWNAVLQVTGRAGVGAERVDSALAASKAKTVRALDSIASAKSDDKAAMIRETFPSKKRKSDGADANASAAWTKADKAMTVIRELLNDKETAWNEGERDALKDALRQAATL